MTLGSGFMPAAQAAAPQVRTQGPGFHRIMVGDFEITALLDGTHAFPVDAVVEGATKATIQRDLDSDFLRAPVQGSINAFLVNTGEKLVLIDSGAGVLYGDCCGHLLANLRAAGYQPEQVDEVLLTHLHKDHVGGVDAAGKMAFPNAIVRASQAEADYWLSPASKARAPDFLGTFFDAAAASVAPYMAAGKFRPFSGDMELEAGIQAMALPGHTPGHTGYLVRSQGEGMLVWGDIVHVAAIQMRTPEATVKYDSNAASAQRSRRAVMDMLAANHYLVGAAHIAFPGLGHIRKAGGRYEWVPVNYVAEPGK
ncbi:MBL fold metallo-hydrolase [Cupriavidus sp. 30B13]|uniref:MBL fold metallo-hydrolase n=1 Tax=Cupriavidus sp. 30B13 TaxID=3384241 RepID=UPI003B8F9FE6